jgi:hypothetical protein
VHSNGYVPGTFGVRAISTVWCDATSTAPSTGAGEPGCKLLAAIKVGALKLCPPSLSFTKRSRTKTPAFSRICSGSNAKSDSRTVTVPPAAGGAVACPVLAGGWTEHEVRATTISIMTIRLVSPDAQIAPLAQFLQIE